MPGRGNSSPAEQVAETGFSVRDRAKVFRHLPQVGKYHDPARYAEEAYSERAQTNGPKAMRLVLRYRKSQVEPSPR